jgi:branched-chain amino acid transport system substrate-binding protein
VKTVKFAVAALLGIGLYLSLIANPRAETLKIGVIAPLTGGGAQWGAVCAEGPRILAEEVNAKGGLDVGGKKYQVEIVAYDDQYKAADAVAAYNRLVNQDGVKYIIVLASPSTLALKQMIENDRVVVLTSAATTKAIEADTRHLFRTMNIPPDYVPPFIRWLKANIPERNVVIIDPNDETGWDQAQISQKLYKENEFNLLGTELYDRSLKDFQPMLTKVIAMKPDIIDLGAGPPATAGLIVRQARELGFKGRFVKTSGPSVPEILAAAGPEGAEGTINLLFVDTTQQGYKRLAEKFRSKIGQEPNELIVTYYDAANVLLHAIQAAGDVNDTNKVAASFAKALPMNSVQGDKLTLGGKATSGADQQIMTADFIGVIKNGKLDVVAKVPVQ